MKKFHLIIISIILGIFLTISYPWNLIYLGMYFTPNPQEPKITYGEFPIKIIYELNGEIKTIEDTIICEYDGIKIIGEAGKYRNWNTYLKSGNEDIVLLNLKEKNEIDSWGHRILYFYYYFGNAEYYMGDTDSDRQREPNVNNLMIDYVKLVNGKEARSTISSEEIFEKYSFRLITCELSPPIENTFK